MTGGASPGARAQMCAREASVSLQAAFDVPAQLWIVL